MSAPYPPQRLAETINLQDRQVSLVAPPGDLVVREHLGLIAAPAVDGRVVYRTERGTLFETRAIKTPGGDYLLMFPTNTLAVPEGRCHYGRQEQKANDLVAFRSSDQGATWHGPTRPIHIDYNLHGFIPLTPRAGNGVPEGRIYCFGTQPIWALHTTRRGLHENAPIGYRYSDDDGHTWSEVRLIRPTNDHGFTGMSVMRMCESEAGTWLLGAHEADWKGEDDGRLRSPLAEQFQRGVEHPEAGPQHRHHHRQTLEAGAHRRAHGRGDVDGCERSFPHGLVDQDRAQVAQQPPELVVGGG